MRKIIYFFVGIAFLACSKQEKVPSADTIVANAIESHGGDNYDTLDIKYRFRDHRYHLVREGGLFQYERSKTDSTGIEVRDILSNQGLVRLRGGDTVQLNKEDSVAYANSVNSVHYFALLPFGLQNSAVKKELLPHDTIKGKEYYTIQVSFKKDGGGKDFDDVFLYWFDQEDFSMDYFAYLYHTDGGGIRFRKRINSQKIEGVIFQDYNNFEVEKGTPLNDLPDLFEAGKLKLLSKIELRFSND